MASTSQTGTVVTSEARSVIGAASSGANSDITSLTGLTTPLSTNQGGTGYNSLAGITSLATVSFTGVLTALANLVVGTGNNPITTIKKVSLSVTPPPLLIGATALLALTFPAATFSANAIILAMPPSNLDAGLAPGVAWVTGANVANISFTAISSTTAGAKTWQFLVIDF